MRCLALLAALLAPAAAMPQPLDVDRFLAEVAAAPEAARPALADAFLERIREAGAPLVVDDSTVVFLYRSAADGAALLGDMTYGGEPWPMERVPGTDLAYLRATFEPEARLEYRFVTPEAPFGEPDPLNPHQVLSGIGPFSELAMPDYIYPEALEAVRGGTPGGYERVAEHELPAGALPYPHEVHVYTPPGYDGGGGDLPTLYLQDGRDYIEFAHVPAALDALIGAGEIEPVLAVFVTPPNRFQPEAPNRVTEYGLNEAYVAFFADELVPFVEARYRARAEATSRLVAGDSFGGLISAYIAFRRPEVFALAHSQSGYHSFDGDRLIRLLEAEPARPVRLFVDVGTYETSVGSGWLPEAETDFLAANRRLRDVLVAKGYDVAYREVAEGHTWGNWRVQLLAGLRHFFGRDR